MNFCKIFGPDRNCNGDTFDNPIKRTGVFLNIIFRWNSEVRNHHNFFLRAILLFQKTGTDSVIYADSEDIKIRFWNFWLIFEIGWAALKCASFLLQNSLNVLLNGKRSEFSITSNGFWSSTIWGIQGSKILKSSEFKLHFFLFWTIMFNSSMQFIKILSSELFKMTVISLICCSSNFHLLLFLLDYFLSWQFIYLRL